MTASMRLVERLREEARQESAACKILADAKTARQTDRDDAWTTAGYSWAQPEQTTRWKAADALETAEKALVSLSRKYAAAYAAVEFAHDEGFEWPTDPFGEEATLFADPTIVPEYAALEKIRSGR